MAQIREELVLEDLFSATFAKYLTYGEKAANTTNLAKNVTQNYQSVLNSLDRRLISANAQFESAVQEQERMVAAGKMNTDAFAALDTRVEKLGTSIRDLTSQYQEVSKQAEIASEAVKDMAESTQQAARVQKQQQVAAQKSSDSVNGLSKLFSGIGKSKAFDSIGKQARRFALTIFSVSQILNFLKGSLERAPDDIQNSWNKMGQSIQDFLAGGVVALLQNLQPAIDRFTAFMESNKGQTLARGLEMGMSVAGEAIAFVLDGITQLAGFIADNFTTVMTIAGVVAAIFAVQMFASAVASMAAAWPILLIVGLITALIVGLKAAGFTSEEIFSAIGAGLGWLYALAYNLVADIWNVIAVFAEFFANVFNDPVGAIQRLFVDIFDAILGIVETVAMAIDALFGTDWASAVSGFRNDVQKWSDDTLGENKIKIERMEKIDPSTVMEEWSQKGAELGKGLDEFSLEDALAAPLKGIEQDVGSIERSVNMSEEDIKSLVDMAERRFVNNVNLTTQAPVITIQGQNTGNTREDQRWMLDRIAVMLNEQVASHTDGTYAMI